MIIPLLITISALWVVHTYLTNRKWTKLPNPGFCYPVVGHVRLFLKEKFTTDPVGSMWNLYRKFQRGGMMWIRIFHMNVVHVGDFSTLRHLFNHPEMQDRMSDVFKHNLMEERMVTHDKGMPGVIMSDGVVWTEQRRFTLRTLRDFGFGKIGMEEIISEEVEMFFEEIKKTMGEPFDFMNKFNLPILNALWRVLVGQRFEYDDPTFRSLIDKITSWFKRAADPSTVFIHAFPWVAKIYPKFMERDKTIAINHEIMEMMKNIIKEHEESLDPNDPRDFMDKVLIEISGCTDPSSSYYGDFGRENLVSTLMDLFVAGSETTSTTLTWAVLYMARYPEVQEKVQEELDRVVGRGRLPSLKDRMSLPYTEAVVMEVQRYANIIPQGVHHLSKKDITVNDITIPAGAMVMPLMAEILKGSYWGDGTTFRPERFLDSEGKCHKDDHLIPFSIGKRQCLGETLAKAELFLFFSGILHQFLLSPEVEGELPSEDYNNGITILPKPFKLRLSTRF